MTTSHRSLLLLAPVHLTCPCRMSQRPPAGKAPIQTHTHRHLPRLPPRNRYVEASCEDCVSRSTARPSEPRAGVFASRGVPMSGPSSRKACSARCARAPGASGTWNGGRESVRVWSCATRVRAACHACGRANECTGVRMYDVALRVHSLHTRWWKPD